MKILKSISEARKFVYTNKVALLAIVSSGSDKGKHVINIVKKLEEISKGVISYAILSLDSKNEITPVITLYVRGRQVFEQNDYFNNLSKDLQALKWGIREVLRNWGVEPPF